MTESVNKRKRIKLTAEVWLDARQMWEADPQMTFTDLAEKIGVTKQSCRQMAVKMGWTKVGQMQAINRAAQIRADNSEVADGNPIATSVDASTDLRAKVIMSHRAEWRKHVQLFPLDKIAVDFEFGKSAKISAEMISIRQKGERLAWGMDNDTQETKSIVIDRSYG